MTKDPTKTSGDCDKTPAGRLRALLAERNWSPARASREAGLGKGAVSDILADPARRPRERTLARLAAALGVDRPYLAGESDVRRAHSRLHHGPGWGGAGAQGAAAALLERIEAEIAASDGALGAYHLPPGAAGLGVPADSTVVVARTEPPRTGDLVVIGDPALGNRIRYLAEPYLIGLDDEGRLRHWLRDDSLPCLGRIVLVVRLP